MAVSNIIWIYAVNSPNICILGDFLTPCLFRVWFVVVHQMVSPLYDPFSVECLSFHKISPFNITRLLNGMFCLGFMFCAPNSTSNRFVVLSCYFDQTFKTVRV